MMKCVLLLCVRELSVVQFLWIQSQPFLFFGEEDLITISGLCHCFDHGLFLLPILYYNKDSKSAMLLYHDCFCKVTI